MKKIYLLLVLLLLSHVVSFADTYEILEVNPSSIKIGGEFLGKGRQFNSEAKIDWVNSRQFMRVKNLTKPNEKPRKFYAESFEKRNAKSINDYFFFTSQTASRGLGSFELGLNKSDFEKKRLALVIGNSEYKHTSYLDNAVGDAILIKDKLKDLGFDVITCYDGNLEEMNNSLNDFCNRAANDHYDIAFFYYAGHGVQSKDNAQLFLLPIDIKKDDHVIKNNCFSALNVRDDMKELGCTSIMFFDACRIDEDIRGKNSKNYSMDPDGTFIAFSTSNGDGAYDKINNSTNGPFASAITKYIGIPGLTLAGAMDYIAQEVSRKTSNYQRPTYNNGLQGPISLAKKSNEHSMNDSETSVSEGNLYIGHEYVDLGLPSGLMWATCNIGATKPEEYGYYFAWGETSGYEPSKSITRRFDWQRYNWTDYNGSSLLLSKYCTDQRCGYVDNKIVLQKEDDAASIIWGGNWRIPTYSNFEELIENCIWTWISDDDVFGYKVVGPNGNSIFFPTAGIYNDLSLSIYKDLFDSEDSPTGRYWTNLMASFYNEAAYELYINEKDVSLGLDLRCGAQSIRPVFYVEEPSKDDLSAVKVMPYKIEITVGDSIQLSDISNAISFPKSLIWEEAEYSGYEDVANVSPTGLVSTKKTGNYFVWAYAKDRSGSLSTYDIQIIDALDSHEYVDLGLPSGLKWASCNVGATKPEEVGLFFTWGETVGHRFNRQEKWPYYKWNSNSAFQKHFGTLKEDESYVYDSNLKMDDDAAHSFWKKEWRMPTAKEIEELEAYCKWEWAKLNNVDGYIVVGPNGKSIFLPYAKTKSRGSEKRDDNDNGLYWSSTPCSERYAISLGYGSHIGKTKCDIGLLVRPVCK